MSKPVVLVTAPGVSDLAQNLLRAGGLDIAFMANPVDEDALVAAFARHPVAAVLLRGSPPFTEKEKSSGFAVPPLSFGSSLTMMSVPLV